MGMGGILWYFASFIDKVVLIMCKKTFPENDQRVRNDILFKSIHKIQSC